jgi:HK97 family phage major capsid protein
LPSTQKLVEQRAAIRGQADDIITRAATESRDLTADELREHARLVTEMREVEDALDAARDAEVRELRAASIATATTPAPIEHRYGQWLIEQRANTIDSATLTAKGRSPIGNDVQTSWFDLVRPQSRLLDGFAWRVIQTDKVKVDIPHLKTDGPATATNESADITGNAGFDAESIEVTPAKFTSYESVSNEVWDDAEPSILEGYGRGIVRRHALAWEAALVTALEADGTAVATDANFATNLDVISDALVTMQAAGATPGGIVCTAAVAQTLLKVKEASGSVKPVLWNDGPATGFVGTVFGLPLVVSSTVTASKAVIFDPSQTVLVVRKSPTIEVSRDALFGTDSVAIRAISRFGAKLMNAHGAYELTDS